MPPFEESRLWRDSLAVQAEHDRSAEVRERLRTAFLRFRERATLMAAEISRDLPDYTVHDVTHLDALWHLADLIAGDGIRLTPTEAFVLGGAFLIHDLGNGLAAYPDGIASLRSSPVWDDTVALVLRRELGRAPTADELRGPGTDVERVVTGDVLRRLHAEHAERLALVSWSDPGTHETFHLIEDSFLRLHFGKLIGRIAHSHWWSARNLPREFASIMGPPAGFPREWTIDPLMLAAILRVTDAAHLDNARAPLWLKVIRKPSSASAAHWIFQEKLNQPIRDGDRLRFTSLPFSAVEADAWWICFDALQMLDNELASVDAILADASRKQLCIRGVQGAGQADRLHRWVETDGWLPVDTRIRVNDVAALASELGGKQLYGDSPLVPLRELIQNGTDAIRARSFLQSWPPDRGEVHVRTGKDKVGYFIEVADNGVGMSPAVMTGYLLDFGRSFWSGPQVSEEFPGLLASGFEPTGKYGIGFFSIFMWSKHVRVTSRRHDAALADTYVLEFKAGLDSRPLFRKATTLECLNDGGTTVRVWFDQDPEGENGLLHSLASEMWSSEKKILAACRWLCPALDTNLFVQSYGEPEIASVKASDWKNLTDSELMKRIATVLDVSGQDDDDAIIDRGWTAKELLEIVTSMLRPLLDDSGNLVGRAALIPSAWRPFWFQVGVITIGGFRSADLNGAAGVLIGSSERAARDSARPTVSLARFHVWLHEQEALVKSATDDAGALLECAATVRSCGAMPEILPIGEWQRGLMTANDLRNWAPIPTEVIVISHDSLALLRRRFGVVELFSNVVAVNSGRRPLIRDQRSDHIGNDWPEDLMQYHELTLQGAVLHLIAELWRAPVKPLVELLYKERENVVVGTASGRQIKTLALVLRK
jgi:hypothetical protein